MCLLLTCLDEEVHYMDITHTGSSMKWCTALLVLLSSKHEDTCLHNLVGSVYVICFALYVIIQTYQCIDILVFVQ